MRKNVVVLYDDRSMPNEKIAQVSGDKSYGSIIFKQKTIRERVREIAVSRKYVTGFYPIAGEKDWEDCLQRLALAEFSTSVLYLYSEFGICDREAFGILLDKAQFLNQPERVVKERRTAALLFPSLQDFQKWVEAGSNPKGSEDMEDLEGDMFMDLSSFDEFIRYITSGFESRYFNALEGDRYTVTKRSVNREKIRKEYQYYYYLPQEMQHWFVQPYDYRENETEASYTMERMHMTDLAIQFVHGAIDLKKYEQILEQLFYFLRTRCTRRISQEEYTAVQEDLYLTKVRKRYGELKANSYFPKMNAMIQAGTDYAGIDEVFAHYERLYAGIQERESFPLLSTVGHGDLCFSNILYQSHANIVRFIDPKGAAAEQDIWTNPLYDLAKLSHSICGRYDFFNSGLYRIEVGPDLKLSLKLDFDNSPYVELFRRCLEENHFSYSVVRLYEASLFLSMLPLHMDNPQKVFGFLLNAITILEEVEQCMKE